MYSRLQVFVAVVLLAVPGTVVVRLLAHTGHGGWAQVLAGALVTWVCLLLLVRRQLVTRLRSRSRVSPGRE